MTEHPENVTSNPPPPPAAAEAPPSPTPPRRPRRKAPAALFSGNPPEPPPSPSSSPPSLSELPAPDVSASGSPDDASKGAKESAPRASSVSPTDRRQLKKALKAGVRTIGGRLNTLADEIERDAGLWIADDQTQEGIAEPASSLIARRSDIVMNPDVADLLALAIAVADYLSAQLDLKAKLRRLRKAGMGIVDTAAAEPPPPPTTGAAA